MAKEKTFNLKINGLDKSYKDVKKLTDLLKELDNVEANLDIAIQQITKVIEQKSNATEQAVQKTQSAKNSIESYKEQITKLKSEYENLSEEERNKIDIGDTLIHQITQLESRLDNLNKNFDFLGREIHNSTTSIGYLHTTLSGASSIMASFGVENQKATQYIQDLDGVMKILQSMQSINNDLFKEGTLTNAAYTKVLQLLGLAKKQDAAASKASADAQNATTIATKGASVATQSFGKALIATGIGAIVVALGTLIANFDEVKKYVYRLIPGLEMTGESLDKLKAIAAGVGEAFVTYITTPIRTAVAVIRKVMERDFAGAVQVGLAETKKAFEFSANYQKGYNQQVIQNEKDNNKAKAQLRVNNLNDQIKDNEAKAGSDWKYSAEGQKAYKDLFEAKKALYADDAEASKELRREEDAYLRELNNYNTGLANTAKSAKKERENNIKAYKQEIETFHKETHQLELENEKQAIELEKEKAQETKDITKENLDEKIQNIETAYEKERILQSKYAQDEREEVEKHYNDLINKANDLKIDTTELTRERDERLKVLAIKAASEQTTIKEEEADAIKRIREKLADKLKDDNQKQIADLKATANKEVKETEDKMKRIKELQEKATVKGAGGIIDVDKTKKNLAEVGKELENYKATLEKTATSVTVSYDQMLAKEKAGTDEYKKLQEEKKNQLDALAKKTEEANKAIADNTKKTTNTTKEYWKAVAAKIQEHVEHIMTGVSAVFSAIKESVKGQLEEANEHLTAISEKYNAVVEQRKASNDRINALQEEAKNARGGYGMVLQEQINQEMAKNQELAQQEAQLAKEKEKAEKEKEKKEKQMKKAELSQNIIQGVSNVALSITKALAAGPFIGQIMAGVAAAAGAVQVGILTKQLAKLEDGGLLRGKRHAQGGMRIEGTNIEVEGGEYVVNRESTNKNLGLVRYINSQRKVLTSADLNDYFSKSAKVYEAPLRRRFEAGGTLPAISNSSNMDNELLVDAIRSIKFAPKVAVTDIIRAQDQLTQVDGWTGM